MEKDEASPELTLRRRLVFFVLAGLLCYGMLEGVSFLAYLLAGEGSFSFTSMQERRAEVIAAPDTRISQDTTAAQAPLPFSHQVLHPYIGYVLDPAKSSDQRRETTEIGEYGFRLEAPLPTTGGRRVRDTIAVAVLGGSVAAGMVRDAAEPLRQVLQRIPAFRGKAIVIYRLSMGGMKQPQQLMILTYFMSLGARFDVVINLDGFNEIVLPAVDNIRRGVFPFYPRAWSYRVAGLTDPDLLREAGRLANMEERRRRVARIFSWVPLRYSITANVFWERIDLSIWNSLMQKRAAATQQLLEKEETVQQPANYVATGPRRTYSSRQAKYADLAAYWKQCSVLLYNMSKANDFYYFHFLQPNQYVADSKVFTEEERANAIAQEHPYREPVEKGYPHLQKAGYQMRMAGVSYTNLTMLFADNTETLYVDQCCHFNKRGYTLMAQSIGRVIAGALAHETSLARKREGSE